jgi:hypothetical protein
MRTVSFLKRRFICQEKCGETFSFPAFGSELVDIFLRSRSGRGEASNGTKPGFQHLRRKTVREFPIFEALPVAAGAKGDDLFNVVRGDVAAADIAIVIVFTVKRADRIFEHETSNLPWEKSHCETDNKKG